MENPGTKINDLRIKRTLTVNQLAQQAQVPASLISGLQTNHRVIGENNARKIGTALKLDGEELKDFIYLAINQCSEKVLEEAKSYPAEVLNLIAVRLRAMGILPDQILHCDHNPMLNDTDAALILSDGTTALINLRIDSKN